MLTLILQKIYFLIIKIQKEFLTKKDNIASTEFLKDYGLEENQNYLLSSSIVNPNLLEIDGPAVSLVFKQVKAKAIFEYLAEVGNYGFVWVKIVLIRKMM